MSGAGEPVIALGFARRELIAGAALLALGSVHAASAAPVAAPTLARVIVDNDFAGDPDGLFQLAHHLLCDAVAIPLIVGSHLPAAFGSGHDAADGVARVREVIALTSGTRRPGVVAGAERPIASRSAWTPSAASRAIVREAMRSDTKVPLIYAAGAGLTDLALAWLAEPRIGQRIRLIWIGGKTPPGIPPIGFEPAGPEFNFSIDPIAAQIVFNESDITVWQVPSATYRQMLFSTAELQELRAASALGAYLKERVDAIPAMLAAIPGVPPVVPTNAYVLGDSPLVTLTALVPPIDSDTSSSRYVTLPTPMLLPDGTVRARAGARAMRVYTDIDSGLTFRDMLARFRLLAKR